MNKILLLFFLFFQSLYANGIIKIALKSDDLNLNPIYNRDDGIVKLLYLGLFYKDNNKILKPVLVDRYTISKDKLKYDLQLIKGIYFKKDDINYGEFNAEDVKFTYDLIKNNLFKSKYKIYYDNIKEIRVIDKYNIQFILKEYDDNFLNNLTLGIMSKNAVAKLGIDYFNTNAIGLGPYYLKQIDNQQIVLLQNKNSNIKTSNNGLIFHFFQNDVQIKNALNNNLIDIATIDYKYLKSLNLNINIDKIKSNKIAVLNINNKTIDDRKLRYALSLIICKQNLIQNYDYLETINTTNKNIYKNQIFYDCDRKKAKELLNNLGYYKERKSIELNINKKSENNYYKKNNNELKLEIYANEKNKIHIDIANNIIQQLKDFGISATLISILNDDTQFKIDDIKTEEVINLFSLINQETKKTATKSQLTDSNIATQIKENYYKEFIKQIQLNPPYIFLASYSNYLVYSNKIKGLNIKSFNESDIYSQAIYWFKDE